MSSPVLSNTALFSPATLLRSWRLRPVWFLTAAGLVTGTCVTLVAIHRYLRHSRHQRDHRLSNGGVRSHSDLAGGGIASGQTRADLARSLAAISRRRRRSGGSSRERWRPRLLSISSLDCSGGGLSVGSQSTLVDGELDRGDGDGGGERLDSQQLSMMALEALATAVNYWQEAASTSTSTWDCDQDVGDTTVTAAAVSSAEESEFLRRVQLAIASSQRLLAECERLFLLDPERVADPINVTSRLAVSESVVTITSVGRTWTVISDSSMDESFHSAAGGRTCSVADLSEFDELSETQYDTPPGNHESPGAPTLALYCCAAQLHATGSVPVRKVRCEAVGVETPSEYSSKLHCLRLAFRAMMQRPDQRTWTIATGRRLLEGVMAAAGRPANDTLVAFDDLTTYIVGADATTWERIADELAPRNVRCFTFFDLALDYILLDALEDLEAPPQAVLVVMQNRWLTAGFKEAALSTAIWSVLRAKRQTLKYTDGFKSRYYSLAEHLIPVLAWGLLGSDQLLGQLCRQLKTTVGEYVQQLFSFEAVRFTSVEEITEDVIRLTRHHCRVIDDYVATLNL